MRNRNEMEKRKTTEDKRKSKTEKQHKKAVKGK